MRRLFYAAALLSAPAVAAVLAASPADAAAKRPVEVRGALDAALRIEIVQAIAPFAGAPASRLEARRRAAEAGDAAMAVLRSEGYYDAIVEPDIGEGDQPVAFIAITVGPRTTLVAPAVTWQGTPPDAASAALAESAMQLKAGQAGRAADVVAAEGRIVAALQQHGYADAAAAPREVVVDHADQSMQPTFQIAAGARVRLDGIVLAAKGRTNPRWAARLAAWKVGEVYTPARVAELERRLRDTGVYDQVTVALSPPNETRNGLRPVIVSLADRPRGTLEFGASYATSEGVGVDGSWILYNHLGQADTITNTLQFANIESRLETDFVFPDWRRIDEKLALHGALYADSTPAYDDWGLRAGGDVTYHVAKTTFVTYGLSADANDTNEKESANFIALNHQRKLATFGALVAVAIDNSNDPLDPTSGWRLDARLEPKAAFGDGSIVYLKAQGQLTGYMPFGATSGTVLAARLKLGAILGGSIPLVPGPDRFYAGGGGSVRGYAYQAVGPRYADNTPEGGLSLFEGSLELRQRLTAQWGLAAFIDAGAAGTTVMPDFRHPDIGVGAGVRYNAGFGPIRLDIATPLYRRRGDSPIQLYISIGQSF
ncbi:MAG TPA: autotransporter assembly complex family protein [Caulobacteraceae bacterium]|nr:autotransporter assembly complex family protein [Caulobacteraceae bacterium]